MVESDGSENKLLRNPAGYKSGFWTSFVAGGRTYVTESTEEMDVFSIDSINKKDGLVKVRLIYESSNREDIHLEFEVELWTFEQPFMLMRHTTINRSSEMLEDFKAYCFMDFDVGGPRSYKDDIGKYDSEKQVMHLWDDNPLYVTLSSSSKPDGWEISSPTKLKIEQAQRDLKKNKTLGPRDIAVALQWNMGGIDTNEKQTVEALVTAAKMEEVAIARMSKGWDWIDQNLR